MLAIKSFSVNLAKLLTQLLTVCLTIYLIPLVGEATAAEIMVLQSHDSSPYRQVLEGLKFALEQHGVNNDYDLVTLKGDEPDQPLKEQIQRHSPRLLVTLGTPATRAALSLSEGIPIVSGLLLDSEEFHEHLLLTGIGLNFPARSQWLWLRRLLPDAQRIAVIYDFRHGKQLFASLQQLARAEKIELLGAPIQTPSELSDLLQQLPTQLDALWAIDGVAGINAVAVRELLLYSFRNRTPLIGLSAQWVKAGAIYALDWDYADLGAQAAELAEEILAKGVAPANLAWQVPRKVRVVFNAKTAEHMKLPMPEKWLQEIDEVVQ